MLRAVNALLMRNVDLGPWIHTGSDCRFLATAAVPTTLEVRGNVVEVFERNGNQWVRYEALVRADGSPVMFVRHSAIYRLAGAEDVSETAARPARPPSRWRAGGRARAR
jgi:hypothetical protein